MLGRDEHGMYGRTALVRMTDEGWTQSRGRRASGSRAVFVRVPLDGQWVLGANQELNHCLRANRRVGARARETETALRYVGRVKIAGSARQHKRVLPRREIEEKSSSPLSSRPFEGE